MALENDFLRLVPIAVLLRTLQVGTVVSVQVLENPVLVPQASICPLWWRIVHCGQGSLLCPRRGGGGCNAGCGSGQGAVGGCTEGRRGGGVSCEHRECCLCVDGRNWCSCCRQADGVVDRVAVVMSEVRDAASSTSMTRAFWICADWLNNIVDIKSILTGRH